jgi:hypothetical protein
VLGFANSVAGHFFGILSLLPVLARPSNAERASTGNPPVSSVIGRLPK